MPQSEKDRIRNRYFTKSVLTRLKNFAISKGLDVEVLSADDLFELYSKVTKRVLPKVSKRIDWACEIFRSGTCPILSENSQFSKAIKQPSKRKPRNPYTPSAKFFKLKKWDTLRKSVLKRYGFKCMKCGATDCVLQVDHIKPRSRFPELQFEFDNLQVLCKDCNMEKGNNDYTDYRNKVM